MVAARQIISKQRGTRSPLFLLTLTVFLPRKIGVPAANAAPNNAFLFIFFSFFGYIYCIKLISIIQFMYIEVKKNEAEKWKI